MAGAWKLFADAKKNIGNGTIVLSTTPMRMALLTTLSTGHITGASLFTSLAAVEVGSANGYTGSGKTLAAVESWRLSTTDTWVFDSSGPTWTASGGSIVAKLAVIYASGATPKLLCYSTLTSSSNVTVASGNSLTVAMNTGGVFMMY